MHLDLTSFQSITDFAKAFKAKKLPLHTLVNNAGVFLVPHDFTQEGFETTVGTNYFGHFLLTHLLLDTIKASAPARHAMSSSFLTWMQLLNYGYNCCLYLRASKRFICMPALSDSTSVWRELTSL